MLLTSYPPCRCTEVKRMGGTHLTSVLVDTSLAQGSPRAGCHGLDWTMSVAAGDTWV